jgi:DNA-binding GntR family transcriptional regulator
VADDFQAYVRRTARDGTYKNTRANVLTTRLRAAIIKGDLAPGQKINLDRLRSEFGVSLSPLREAISRLAVDGLVLVQDQRGASIAPLSHEELEEIGRVRREVDMIAVRDAIERGGSAWATRLRDAAFALHAVASCEKSDDLAENWAVAQARFYQALIAGCQMPMFIAFCTNLSDLQERYHRQLPGQSTDLVELWRRHAEIASWALDGNVEAATTAIRDYHDRCIATLAERLADAHKEGRF